MKKDTIKKGLCLGLSAAMVMALAACGKGGDDGNGGTGGANGGGTVTVDPVAAKQNVYTYTALELNFDDFNLHDCKQIGNDFYLASTIYDYENEIYSAPRLIRTDASLSSYDVIELAIPEIEKHETMGGDTGKGEGVDDGDMEIMPYAEEPAVDEGIGTDDIYYPVDDDWGWSDPDGGVYEYESTYFERMLIGTDGTVMGLMNYYYSYYDYSTDYNEYEENYYMCGWDLAGNVKWCTSLADYVSSDWFYINSSAALNDGTAILFCSGNENFAMVIDSDGNVVKNIAASGSTNYLNNLSNSFVLNDGRLAVMYYDEVNWNTCVGIVDLNTLNITESLEFPANLAYSGYNAIAPGIDTDFVVSTNSGVSSFNIGDAETVEFMNYISSDFPSYYLNGIQMLDSTHFIGIFNDSTNWQSVIAKFEYVDPSTIPDKEVISLATYWLGGDVRSRVVDFNKNSDKYRIIVTDYSKYSTEDDYSAGYTKLNNEIISGIIPDIIMADTYNLDLRNYAKKGMFADISELIAADPELSKYTYLDNVFDAYAVDGKRFMMVYTFDFCTYMGSRNYFGEYSEWNVTNFTDFIKKHPDVTFIEFMTQSDFLRTLISYTAKDYIDVDNGTCDFQNDDFIAMLQYAATLPAEIDWNSMDDSYYMDYAEKFRSGKVALMNEYLYEMQWYQQSVYEYFDGNAMLIGFPSRGGNNAYIQASTPICISASGNVEGAWEFARYYLTPEYQESRNYDIPVLESAFNKWAETGMERPFWTDEKGEKHYYDNYYYVDGVEKMIPPMTQADVDEIKTAIKSCTNVPYNNEAIMGIIEEEASACFSGQKTAAEVAASIQSRVNLYIMENQ